MKYAAIFISGLLFSLGLGVSQMTQPSKIIGFLDIFGDWDPSMALVMVGALVTYSIAFRWIIKRPKPVFGKGFALPTRNDIDRPLILGAVLFGAGWGLAGYCPGPAITASVTGNGTVLIFVLAMAIGMYAFEVLDVRFASEPDGGAGLLDGVAASKTGSSPGVN